MGQGPALRGAAVLPCPVSFLTVTIRRSWMMSAVYWCKICLLWCVALPPVLFYVRDSTGTCGTRAFALRHSPRYARPWLRSGVIGGGSTGVLCSVVAFATIRPRRVRRGRLWRCVDDCLFVCALLRGRWVAGELSYGVRALQRQRKRHQPPPRRAFWGFVR